MRALGAGPAMAMADGLLGVVGAIAAGSLLAVGVAVGLSPLAPIGPVRPVYPDIGVAFDWIGPRFRVPLVRRGARGDRVCSSPSGVAPHRLAQRPDAPERDPGWVRAAAAGLPPSAVLGIRSALGERAGRGAAPVRSALLGAVIAITVIVTSLTFASSLNALVSQPPLYGWNWDYAAAGWLLGRREPAGGGDDRTARPRSRCGPLGRRLLRERQPGRAVRARAGHETGRRGEPRPCSTGHALASGLRSCSGRRPWRRCTHTSATPSSRRRTVTPRSACASSGRRPCRRSAGRVIPHWRWGPGR